MGNDRIHLVFELNIHLMSFTFSIQLFLYFSAMLNTCLFLGIIYSVNNSQILQTNTVFRTRENIETLPGIHTDFTLKGFLLYGVVYLHRKFTDRNYNQV